MMRFPHLAALALSLNMTLGASACSSPSDATPPPPQGTGARLLEVASGLSVPLYVTAPPGDATRLFIVEKTGGIRIVKDGTLLKTPFLDLSGQVSTTGGEQGLLGLAFDPNYASNGRFFVHYTDPAGDTRVSSFQVSTDPDIADAGSEQVILTADQPYTNHNGGQLVFGPDGLLYLGLGDGGSEGDPQGRSQDLSDLLGSILRLNVTAGSSYTVPPDNPFVAQTAARPEIWSYGLRNPWRFSFDRGTGDLYIADVGDTHFEEVDVSPAAGGAGKGANYGWDLMEGNHCFSSGQCDRTGLTLPAYEYAHSDGCSITGGYVYRGSAIPALQGLYFFGDYCKGWVRSFRYVDGAATEPTEWQTLRPGRSITSFGEDAAGELYLTVESGRVFKIVPEP
jgi:glucose/arabinose dehydrogenase